MGNGATDAWERETPKTFVRRNWGLVGVAILDIDDATAGLPQD